MGFSQFIKMYWKLKAQFDYRLRASVRANDFGHFFFIFVITMKRLEYNLKKGGSNLL